MILQCIQSMHTLFNFKSKLDSDNNVYRELALQNYKIDDLILQKPLRLLTNLE